MATNKKIFASKKSITIFFDVEKGIKDKIINPKHNIQLPSSKTEKNIIQENAKNFASNNKLIMSHENYKKMCEFIFLY